MVAPPCVKTTAKALRTHRCPIGSRRRALCRTIGPIATLRKQMLVTRSPGGHQDESVFQNAFKMARVIKKDANLSRLRTLV